MVQNAAAHVLDWVKEIWPFLASASFSALAPYSIHVDFKSLLLTYKAVNG